MHDLKHVKVPKITDSKEFELLCRDIWRNVPGYSHVELNGRTGQSQDGVDVFGRKLDSRKWFGIQCRVRERASELTKDDLVAEIGKARRFNPALAGYCVCTTLDRDARLQGIARDLADQQRAEGGFAFGLKFWDDIEETLKSEDNLNVYHRYYHAYFADNTTLGHAIGTLVDLELGVGSRMDTHYELLLGKIPSYRNSDEGSVNYYRSTYFIVNFHERKMETFNKPCFASDLEAAFGSMWDRVRIAKWINDIGDLDSFIYQNPGESRVLVTDEELQQFIREMRDEDT